MESFEDKSYNIKHRYIKHSFMCVCKYVKQRVRREQVNKWKIFQECFKNKKRKKTPEEIEYHNSIPD